MTTLRIRRSTWTALGIPALLLGLARPGAAQSLGRGDRIRVTQRDGSGVVLVGQLARLTRDSLWLTPIQSGDDVAFPLGPRIQIEKSLGRHSRAGLGASIGAGVGAVITVVFLSQFCGGDNLCNGDEEVRAALIFGLPSIAIGAGVGALVRIERWAPVGPGALRSAARLTIGFSIAR